MVDFWRPPELLGEEPSAAQNGPVTKTCTQCGAINKAQVYRCCFCEAPLPSVSSARESSAPMTSTAPAAGRFAVEEDWKRELEHRLEAYRSRRKRLHPHIDQGALPFSASTERAGVAGNAAADRKRGVLHGSVRNSDRGFDPAAVISDPAEAAEEFAFAIGIGPRPQSDCESHDAHGRYRVEIDLTRPPLASFDACAGNQKAEDQPQEEPASRVGSPYFPLASFQERCLAGCIDTILLFFAYGGFLTLFGSLGGHFSFSKFSAVVYVATLALFYVQYFALFTIFGGVTPGMMLRHLELVNFDGEVPTPRQLLQRSFGYLVSGATFLLGFFWALWDEDRLTWQDRISNTYLTSAAALLHAESLRGADVAGVPQK